MSDVDSAVSTKIGLDVCTALPTRLRQAGDRCIPGPLKFASSAWNGTRIALLIFGLLVMALLAISRPLMAQTTVGTGSIVGIVSDPSGAVVVGAEITIANQTSDVGLYPTSHIVHLVVVAALPGFSRRRKAAIGPRKRQVICLDKGGNIQITDCPT